MSTERRLLPVLGRDHALSGAVVFTAAAPLLHTTGPQLLAGVVVAAGAGVLPDIDHPDATISRTFGVLTRGFAWLVEHATGGHRHGTHSLAGIAAFTAAAWAATDYDRRTTGMVVLAVVLALLVSAALRALHVGGHHGDALGAAAAAAMIVGHVGLGLVPVAVAVGVAAHVAGDMATHGGCPLGWPVSRHEFHLLPKPLEITTGKLAEHWLVTPLLTLALVLLIYRNLDPGALAALTCHLHAAC